MNKNKLIVLFGVVMVLLVVSIGLVQARGDSLYGRPPTQEMIEEINATRGSALLKFYPEYAVQVIPATGSSSTFCVLGDVTNRAALEQIIQRQGSVYAVPCGR